MDGDRENEIMEQFFLQTLFTTIVTGVIGKLYFDRKLEEVKASMQKEVHNYDAYNEKRHIALQKIYRALCAAQGAIYELRGAGERPDFRDYDKTDIKIHLEQINTTNKETERIVNLWETNQKAAEIEILKYDRLKKMRNAEQKFWKANNQYYFLRPYFSDSIDTEVETILKKERELLSAYDTPGALTSKEQSRMKEDISQSLDSFLKKVKAEMKKA